MDRRAFISIVGGSMLAPLAVGAQPRARVSSIGILWTGPSPPPPPRPEWFRIGLGDVGFIEGQNATVIVRYAEDRAHLRERADELVRAKVDVIAAFGDLAPQVAQQATTTIPIVALADDFVGAGLATNLARPGGNTTGVTILGPELSAKRLQLLKEIFPKMSRVAALWDPATPSQLATTEAAARSLGIRLQVLEVRGRDDLDRVFEAARKGRAQALNVLSSPVVSSLHATIVAIAAKDRLPAIYQWKEHAQAGGLMSYGPSLGAMWQQTAHVVGRILKGANPADLPIEQPTKFELVINLKTAKALGLTIPQSLLVRADEIIQ
jgi:ABC-type uncharacterized transport system substrate-binding protein